LIAVRKNFRARRLKIRIQNRRGQPGPAFHANRVAFFQQGFHRIGHERGAGFARINFFYNSKTHEQFSNRRQY